MKYIHPDIVIGEPIPEIEPRVNQEVLETSLKGIRYSRWASVLLILLIVISTLIHFSWTFKMGAVALMLTGIIVWSLRPTNRAKRKKQWKNKGDYWSIPLRINIEIQCMAILVMMLTQMLISSQNGISGLGSFIGIIALIGGGGLLWVMQFIREPGQICCVDCEYPLVGLTLPCPCPECGRSLVDAQSTTDRPRVHSAWFGPVGMITMVFGGLILYSSFANPSLMYAPMPRAVLLQLAPTEKGAFNQLISRPIDQTQTDDLIERLIAGNEGSTGWDYSTFDQQQWLTKFAGTGRISKDQYDRIYGRVADWVRIELVNTPENKIVQVGKEAEVRLASSRYINLPTGGVIVRYFFRGFEIGDETDDTNDIGPIGGNQGENYLSFLDAKVGDHTSYQYVPRAIFVPTKPGPLVIRAKLVVVMHTVRKITPIDWDNPDNLFKTAPDWSTTIDLEHTIEVKP